MKGTFFSADFVKDSDNQLRLIEINTDTAVIMPQVNNIDLSGLISVMSSNSINTLDIIYKPYIHNELVAKIKEIIASDATFITTVNEHKEDFNTIYPTAVSDAANKFILRLAYDESAILDSTYAKNRLNIFNLFSAASGSSGHTVEYYHSGSTVNNFLTASLDNPANIPDFIIKDVDETHNPIDFYKVGSEVADETVQARVDAFIAANKAEDKVFEKYHYHSSSVDSDGKITSFRQFAIVYGTDLDITNVVGYKISAVLDLPTSITYNTGSYTNKLGDHHYYEFTTNFIKDGSAGVLSSHKIEMADDSFETLANVSVGDTIKSYFISGSPQVESDADTVDWYLTGSQFPSGSYITSSDVVYKETKNLKYGGIIKLNIDNDDIYVGSGKQFLVYDSGSDRTTFELSQNIDPDNHYFFDISGSLIDIDTAEFVATTDTDLQFVELDVEDTDTYLISGSTTFNSIVSHNAPCFVAGTLIKTGDGIEDNALIEDVAVGDKVLTYNFKTDKTELQSVSATGIKKVNKTITYTFEGGSTLEATLDHPLYCERHGWVSGDPAYTSVAYNLTTTEASVGCMIKKFDGSTVKISNIAVNEKETLVYNLRTVDVNHNFFANEYLAHNRGACFLAGTLITLADNTTMPIEEVGTGNLVMTLNPDGKTKEGKLVYEILHPKHMDIVTYTFDNGTEIKCTADHPFYISEYRLASVNPDKTNDLYDLDTEVIKINEGDTCQTLDGEWTTITSIEEHPETVDFQTFLIRVEDNHNFYANGILVHNK